MANYFRHFDFKLLRVAGYELRVWMVKEIAN